MGAEQAGESVRSVNGANMSEVSHHSITINDVARLAGVSKSAVSYAMNGQRGVSAETREKVLRAAEELGWKPKSAAGIPLESRSRSIGVVLQVYDIDRVGGESFAVSNFIGLSRVLAPAGYSLDIRVVTGGVAQACAVHEEWMREHRVDAHMVTSVEMGDPRMALFRSHPEVPVLFLSQRNVTRGLPTLYSSDADGARRIVRYLHGLGHRRISRIAGPERYVHTLVRDRAAQDECMALGIRYDCLHGDYSAESGEMLFDTLMGFGDPPTAIICDNDVMATAVLSAAVSRGVSVPDELSLVSWDDSAACRMSDPPLTALSRDVEEIGKLAGRLLLDLIDGGAVDSISEPPYALVERGSTASPAPERASV